MMASGRSGTALKIAAIAVATVCLATTAFAAPPSVKYDRFKGHTEITSQEQFNHNGAIETQWIEAIVQDHKFTTLQFSYWYTASEWKYLNCHDIAFLIGDKPFEPASTDFKNMLNKG